MRRFSALIVFVVLLCTSWRSHALDELPLKAAIIFNLLLFVEWPGEAELPPGAPLLLCGDRSAPLWPHLKLLQDRQLRQRRLETRDVASPEEQRACHAWVLEEAGQKPLSARIAGVGPTLVIGDGGRGDETGVTIALRMTGSRLQFDIDMVQARQQRLQLSSKMLRLARRVRE